MKRLLLLLLLLAIPRFAWSAAVVSGSSAGTCASHAGSTLTWTSHDIEGANRLLFVYVVIQDAATSVSTITLGAQNLALVSGGELDNTLNVRAEVWKLIAPNTGAGTITVNASGEPAYGWCAYEIGLTGVHQSTPYGAVVPNQQNGVTSSTINVTGVANGLVLDFMTLENGGKSPVNDSAQTVIQQVDYGPSANTSYKGGSGTLTMQWTFSSDNVVHMGIPIYPVATSIVRQRSPIIIQ